MQKRVNNILRNDKIIFVLIFVLGIIVSFKFLFPSYSFDGYCQLNEGYHQYANYFYAAGRIITGLIWNIIGILRIPHNFLSIIAQILSIIIQSATVLVIYRQVSISFDKSLLARVICLLGSTLLVFNPYVMDFYIYEESFCMFLSFFLSALAAKKILSNKNLLSLVYLLCSVSLYQGTLCAFLPLVMLFILFKDYKKSLKDLLKDNIWILLKSALIYGAALVFGFLSIKCYNLISPSLSSKTGYIDIVENVKRIGLLMYETIKYHQGMFDPNMFKIFLMALTIIYIVFISLIGKKAYKHILSYIIVIITCVVICFVPNLAMRTDGNYTAARMLCSMGMVFGTTLLFSLIISSNLRDKEKNVLYIVTLFIGCSFMMINFANYIKNMHLDSIRYQNDTKELEAVNNKIKEYEIESGKKIKEIYYVISHKGGPYYESFAFSYYLPRVKDSEWAFACAVSAENDFDMERVSLNYINDKLNISIDENEIDKDIYYFIDDMLYLIVY